MGIRPHDSIKRKKETDKNAKTQKKDHAKQAGDNS